MPPKASAAAAEEEGSGDKAILSRAPPPPRKPLPADKGSGGSSARPSPMIARHRTVATAGDTPAWVYPAIAVLVAVLIALTGTAYMLATPEELEAAWAYKGDVLSAAFWKGMLADGMEAMRYALAKEDRGHDPTGGARLGQGDPSLSSPEGKQRAASLGSKRLDQVPPPATVEKERLERRRRTGEGGAPSPGDGSKKGDGLSPSSLSSATGTLTCLTLEEYSDRFVASERERRQGKRFFRCGTRLVDLRAVAADSPEAMACAAPSASSSSATLHPSLRTVLTPRESEWHKKQKLNLAVQVFPLSHLNDNYCDCLDGTDEVSTGACSMSGPGMPLGFERWRAYVVANKDVRLYEDQADDGTGTASDSQRGSAAPHKKRALNTLDVNVLGGPVLPFLCAADTETWVSPTMLGDGIVDCCDGSDESSEAWLTAAAGASPADIGALRQAVLTDWTARRESASRYHDASVSYVDGVHPHYTCATALLIDKGYTALHTCPTVHAQRLASAETLLAITAAGHAIMQQREADGWEQLGRVMLENQTQIAERLANTTREIQSLRYHISSTMEKAQTMDPLQAGIPMSDLQRYEQLVQQHGMLEQEASYLSLMVTQKVFGERYEYYPLFAHPLVVSAKDVLTSFRSDAVSVRRRHARHRLGVQESIQRMQELAYFDKYAAMAEAQGMEVPPRPPLLHVDNISVAVYGVVPARVGLSAQHMSETDAETVARGKGLIESGELYNREELEEKYDIFARSPTYTLGHWQPYRVDRNASVMAMLDPAGDVDLPRRFSIAPNTRLTRGGGRLPTPTRMRERDRSFTIAEEDSDNGGPAARSPLSPREGEKKKEIDIPILYHRNTPNLLATHNFDGGSLRCALSQSDAVWQGGGATTSLRVAYGCAMEDGILAWARNGKCKHEVLIGTPSACTRWVLREVERQVERYRALARG